MTEDEILSTELSDAADNELYIRYKVAKHASMCTMFGHYLGKSQQRLYCKRLMHQKKQSCIARQPNANHYFECVSQEQGGQKYIQI